MMDHMMGGRMMWGMGLIGVLIIIVLILAAAALVKYIFFSGSK
jgi:hypothetical protein